MKNYEHLKHAVEISELRVAFAQLEIELACSRLAAASGKPEYNVMKSIVSEKRRNLDREITASATADARLKAAKNMKEEQP